LISWRIEPVTDLCNLTVTELSAGIAAGQYTSSAITEACLARIAALEPKLQAFVELYDKEARAWRRAPSAPTPAARCAFPPPGAALPASRPASDASALMA
jgi:aspartyl-tRNA(Asn)/glutamyl-tRNA(Gln) amidotransferase subunit A